MIRTLLWIAWVNLRRDRVALVLTFVLPIVFFSIFAMIFGGLGGGSMPPVELVLVDEDRSETSARLVRAIQKEPGFKGPDRNDKHAVVVESADRAIALVKDRRSDAAVVLPKGYGAAFGNQGSDTPALIVYADDVANPVAAQVVQGLLQKIAMTAMPDLAIERGIGMFEKYAGALTEEQRAAMARFLPELRALSERQSGEANGSASGAASGGGSPTGEGAGSTDVPATGTPAAERPSADIMSPVRVETRNVKSVGEERRKASVTYQAAGIGVMFLLFSMTGAMGAMLQESGTGTLERLLSTRLTMGRLLAGWWLYAVAVGFAQLSVMFLWGWAVFGVELWTTTHTTGFAAMTLVSAAAAAAFGLLLGTACRSQGQLQGISTVVILCMSALGGSMVPRFILKQNAFMDVAGLFTFNGWALDGYQKVFWDDKPVWELWPQLGVLGGMTLVCLVLARQFARRWETV